MADPQKIPLEIPRVRKEVLGGHLFVFNVDTQTRASLWDNDDNEIVQPLKITKEATIPQTSNGIFLNVATGVRWEFYDQNDVLQYANSESFPPFNPDLDSKITQIENKLRVWLVQNLTPDNTADVVSFLKQTFNLDSGGIAYTNIDLPAATLVNAGTMSKEQVATLQGLVATMTGVAHSAVVEGLGATPSNSDLTTAFTTALNQAPTAGDRVIDIANSLVWVIGNTGSWIKVGAPTDLATNSVSGSIIGNNIDGGIVFPIPGLGKLQGWDKLLALFDSTAMWIATGEDDEIFEITRNFGCVIADSAVSFKTEWADDDDVPDSLLGFINNTSTQPVPWTHNGVFLFNVPSGFTIWSVNATTAQKIIEYELPSFNRVNAPSNATIVALHGPTIITQTANVAANLNIRLDNDVPTTWIIYENKSNQARTVVNSDGSSQSVPAGYTALMCPTPNGGIVYSAPMWPNRPIATAIPLINISMNGLGNPSTLQLGNYIPQVAGEYHLQISGWSTSGSGLTFNTAPQIGSGSREMGVRVSPQGSTSYYREITYNNGLVVPQPWGPGDIWLIEVFNWWGT